MWGGYDCRWPGRIEVRIDELVLDGLTPTQAAVVADAVRAQLAVGAAGLHTPGRTVVDRLDGGFFVMAGGMTPWRSGRGSETARCARPYLRPPAPLVPRPSRPARRGAR